MILHIEVVNTRKAFQLRSLQCSFFTLTIFCSQIFIIYYRGMASSIPLSSTRLYLWPSLIGHFHGFLKIPFGLLANRCFSSDKKVFLVHFNFKFISQNDCAVTLSFGCRPTVAFLIYGFFGWNSFYCSFFVWILEL